MSPRSDYDAQASGFAGRLSHLLNSTITTGIRITSVLSGNAEAGWVGYKVKPRDFVGRLIAVKRGRDAASCYLQVGMTLQLDPEVRKLVVEGSTMGVYCRDDFESMVFHYDFKREPDNDYPLAHCQIAGTSGHLDELCARAGLSRTLERFHFPVGGKRYRPTIEDVIEFLIVEQISKPHDGWGAVLRQHREEWERIQLRSVVRRDPATAAEELRRQGYTIAPPAP